MSPLAKCKNCGGELHRAEFANLWLHNDEIWRCSAKSHAEPIEQEVDTVTITISRETAEELHRYYWAEDKPHEQELAAALQAALKETE